MTLKMYLAPMLLVIVFAVAAQAQTGIFTYQGRLTDGTSPAGGTYQMQFALFDSLAGPTQIGTTITVPSVTVTNGVFTVNLDFFPETPFKTGADRFLEIAVRKASDPPGFTLLTPRQQISSSPYSIRTLSAGAADSLSAACASCVTDAHVSDTLTVGPSGSVHDSALPATVMRTTGATMTGALNMGNQVITNIGAAGTNFTGTGGLTLAENLTVGGNLQVNNNTTLGTASADTVIVNATLAGAVPLVFEGGIVDANETTLAIAEPSADRTITLPNATGTVITTGNLSSVTSVGTISSGTWNGTEIAVANGGTGSTTAPGARANLGAAASGANSDITQLTGLTGTVTIAPAAALTTAINVSDPDITNAISVGDNTILGSTAAIDFANFDVSSGGNVTAQGLVSANTLRVGGGSVVTSILQALTTLDFPNTAAQSSSDLTIAVTGAQFGDAVSLGSSPNPNSSYTAFVSTANVVTVRFLNISSAAIDPPSGPFRVVVIRF